MQEKEFLWMMLNIDIWFKHLLRFHLQYHSQGLRFRNEKMGIFYIFMLFVYAKVIWYPEICCWCILFWQIDIYSYYIYCLHSFNTPSSRSIFWWRKQIYNFNIIEANSFFHATSLSDMIIYAFRLQNGLAAYLYYERFIFDVWPQ